MEIRTPDILRRYLEPHGFGVPVAAGCCCTLAAPVTGSCLAVSVDSLVEGVHFSPDTPGADVAWRSLAVNVSDMAAMGAQPLMAALVLTIPREDPDWLEAFSEGLREAATHFDVRITGLAVSSGPLAVSLQIHGSVPPDMALRRKGARPGDRVFVTGTLGDAGLALLDQQGRVRLGRAARVSVLPRLNRPEPRVSVGIALRGIASSAIDISDGLAADLGHILAASGVGATVDLDSLPLSVAVRAAVADSTGWDLPLAAGDDYELCFTVPPERNAALDAMARDVRCGITRIGVIEAAAGLRLCLPNGEVFVPKKAGYDHFS